MFRGWNGQREGLLTRRTSHLDSHWSRSCSALWSCRSKCSALTSTCRSLRKSVTGSIAYNQTQSNIAHHDCHILLDDLLGVLLCSVELLFKQRNLAVEALCCRLALVRIFDCAFAFGDLAFSLLELSIEKRKLVGKRTDLLLLL